ncbi:protein of unknown function [Pararobbsia alpina]
MALCEAGTRVASGQVPNQVIATAQWHTLGLFSRLTIFRCVILFPIPDCGPLRSTRVLVAL